MFGPFSDYLRLMFTSWKYYCDAKRVGGASNSDDSDAIDRSLGLHKKNLKNLKNNLKNKQDEEEQEGEHAESTKFGEERLPAKQTPSWTFKQTWAKQKPFWSVNPVKLNYIAEPAWLVNVNHKDAEAPIPLQVIERLMKKENLHFAALGAVNRRTGPANNFRIGSKEFSTEYCKTIVEAITGFLPHVGGEGMYFTTIMFYRPAPNTIVAWSESEASDNDGPHNSLEIDFPGISIKTTLGAIWLDD